MCKERFEGQIVEIVRDLFTVRMKRGGKVKFSRHHIADPSSRFLFRGHVVTMTFTRKKGMEIANDVRVKRRSMQDHRDPRLILLAKVLKREDEITMEEMQKLSTYAFFDFLNDEVEKTLICSNCGCRVKYAKVYIFNSCDYAFIFCSKCLLRFRQGYPEIYIKLRKFADFLPWVRRQTGRNMNSIGYALRAHQKEVNDHRSDLGESKGSKKARERNAGVADRVCGKLDS